jgi:hypothetical protein
MNMVLAKAGYSGTNSDAAKSFAGYGQRISEPRVGAIAVLSRGNRGGHVGVVSGIDAQGNPIIIFGNHNKRVGEATYPRARVIAFVMPTEERPTTIQMAARSGPNRAKADVNIDSPITELLAAIEAEQRRADSRPQPPRAPAARPPQPQAPQRAVQQLPPQQAPHRTVQQVPEQVRSTAQPAPRALPMDPALAELLGIRPPVVPPRPLSLHAQQPGRVAAAPSSTTR